MRNHPAVNAPDIIYTIIHISARINEQVKEFESLTFVTVLYGKGSLGGFVVSHVAEAFTFSCELIFDDHTILDTPIFLNKTEATEND